MSRRAGRGRQGLRQRVSRAPPGPIIARVRNASDQPIYDLMIGWHRGSAPWGKGDILPPLMPGEEAYAKRALPDDLPEHADPLVFRAVAFFRDAAGIRWRARPDGQLDEITPGQEPPHS